MLYEVITPEIISLVHAVIVLTDNEELNKSICEVWSNYVKKEQLFYWGSGFYKDKYARSVWNFIPKPSDISFELKDEKNSIVVSANNRGTTHVHYKEHLLIRITSYNVCYTKLLRY